MFKKFFNNFKEFIIIGGEFIPTKFYKARIGIACISARITTILASIKSKFAYPMILLHACICTWAVH